MVEDIIVDTSKCEKLDNKNIIRIPNNSRIDFNGHFIRANYNVYLYNEGINCILIDFLESQKGMLDGILFKGNFSFIKPVRLSNISNSYNNKIFTRNLNNILNYIINSNIIWDIDNNFDGIIEAVDIELGNNTHINGQNNIFYISQSIKMNERSSIENSIIKSYYGGNIHMYNNTSIKSCTISNLQILVNEDYCSIINNSIKSKGISLFGKKCIIRQNTIDCGDNNSNPAYKPIYITSSNNTIIDNICSGGFVGIQLMFYQGKTKKCIENNYIARNYISNQKEEALSMDCSGSRYMNAGEFLGFENNTIGNKIKIKFDNVINDVSEYIDFYLYGISDITMGMFAKIIAIENKDSYSIVTLDRIMFNYYFQNNEEGFYPFNESIAIARGYDDYTNSMFAVGSAFVGNVFDNNTIEKNSINLYGCGFANMIINNKIINASSLDIYLISNAKNKYMNNVKILPICNNIISNNSVINGSINLSYSNNLGDEDVVDRNDRISKDYIAFNSIIGNISKTIYCEGFCCNIDTSLVTNKRNGIDSYNLGIDTKKNIVNVGFIEESEYLNRILKSSTKRIIVKKSNGTFGIYSGKNSGDYNENHIIEEL